jgi:hypothetical protein
MRGDERRSEARAKPRVGRQAGEAPRRRTPWLKLAGGIAAVLALAIGLLALAQLGGSDDHDAPTRHDCLAFGSTTLCGPAPRRLGP